MNNFFDKVLPNAPVYLLAFFKPDGKMGHKVCHNKQDFLVYASSMVNQDLFFALSGYAEGWHTNPYDHTKQSLRTQRNSLCQRSLWLDLDVGEGKEYLTQQQAVDDLCRFCNELQLPYPIMVSSGYGVHAYFPFDRDVLTEEWTELAYRFRQATIKHNLKADQKRTTDSASILRVPGSVNLKDPSNPQPVRIFFDAQPTNLDYIKSVLAKYEAEVPSSSEIPQFEIPDYVLSAIERVDDDFSWLVDQEFVDLDLIIQGCRQIRECGSSTRSAWIGAFTILCHGKDGYVKAHELSAQDPRYDKAVTDAEYASMSSGQFGPTLCSTFASYEPGKCVGCQFYNQIKSPIVLGKKKEAEPKELVVVDESGNKIETETLEDYTEEYEELVAVGALARTEGVLRLSDFKNFVHDGEGVIYRHPRKGKMPAYDEVLFHRLPKPLYILTRMDNKVISTDYMWEIIQHNDTKRVIRMTHVDISTQAGTIKWLASAMLLPSVNLHKQAYEYMSYYIQELQQKLPIITKQEGFGWGEGEHRDGTKIPTFVLGEHIYTPGNLPAEVELDGFALDYAQRQLGCMGTIEGWKEGLKAYDKNDHWAQFGICLGFGAPLMKLFNNTAKNGIVNFFSGESGTGKSTLQNAIASIWGHPVEQVITGTTHNARLELMGLRKNLPMINDEITGIEGKELSELIFSMANGSGKLRLNQDSSLKPIKRWETISITSANNTLLDKLVAMSSSREGEQMRALDVFVPKTTKTREEFDRHFTHISSNYGVAGRAFINCIINTPTLLDHIPGFLQAKATGISNKASHRFWANTIAAALVGGAIAKQLGLIDYDLEAIERYAIKVMHKQGVLLRSSRQEPNEILADFINDMRPHTVVVKEESRDTALNPVPSLPNSPDGYVISLPTQNSLYVRYEAESKTAYISSKEFKNWAKEANHSFSHLIDKLKEAGVLEDSRRVYINKDVPKLPSTRISCYKVNMSKCDIDLGGLVDESAED